MSLGAQKRIAKLLTQLKELGPVHPGRITKQFNVCGKAGCRCKDPKHPKKHGPYHYLSFTFEGKGRTIFIPAEQVAEMQRRTLRFVKFKALMRKLIEANMALARSELLRRESGR